MKLAIPRVALIHQQSKMVAVSRVAALVGVALSVAPAVAVATPPALRGRRVTSVDDGPAPHYWVSPLIDEPVDKACYRRTYRGKPCPRGYDWDGALACWAQCPLEYPVECGAECLQHNRACTKEIMDKAGSVVTTALNAVSAGVFGQLAATSSVVKLGLTCSNKMLPVVKHIADFVSDSARAGIIFDTQFKIAIDQEEFFSKDLPAAIALCMGREPLSSAGPPPMILQTMQLVLDKVIEYSAKGKDFFSDGSFFDFLDAIGLSFGDKRQRQLRSTVGWNDARNFLDSSISCGHKIKQVIDNITEIVKEQRMLDSSCNLQSLRFAVMNSDVFLRDLPDVVVECVNATDLQSLRKRDQILKAAHSIVDQVLDAAITPSGKPRPIDDFLVVVSEMGLDALSAFDPTGIASMVREFVQPICGPSIFPRAIDDGPADTALGLRTVETAFRGSSGYWLTTLPDPTTDVDSSVQIIFRSSDVKDVTVEIASGGNSCDEVKVPAKKTVTWTKPLAQLQGKTLYMVRSRPGFMWIKGKGGGSLLTWIPEVPKEGTGMVKLDVMINPPSEREEMISLALQEEAIAQNVAKHNASHESIGDSP